VVPILALEVSKLAPLGHHGGDGLSESCCQVLVEFDAKVKKDVFSFFCKKILHVNGGLARKKSSKDS
jgi:hypothetical protein